MPYAFPQVVHLNLRPLLVSLMPLFLWSCTQVAPKPVAMTDEQACTLLKQVQSQAGNGFKALRGSAVNDYSFTGWDAKPIVPGTDCDVVQWGPGRTNYACTWAKGDEPTARADYESGIKLVRDCLGSGWNISNPDGQTGKATLFSRPGEPGTVEVRYYKEREPSRNWQTSLTIGPPVTRDAR